MTKKYVPKRLWDYGMRWVVEIMQRTASDASMLHGMMGLEMVTGETPEISEYIDFGFMIHAGTKRMPAWTKPRWADGWVFHIRLEVSCPSGFSAVLPCCIKNICPEDYELGTAGGNQQKANDRI